MEELHDMLSDVKQSFAEEAGAEYDTDESASEELEETRSEAISEADSNADELDKDHFDIIVAQSEQEPSTSPSQRRQESGVCRGRV